MKHFQQFVFYTSFTFFSLFIVQTSSRSIWIMIKFTSKLVPPARMGLNAPSLMETQHQQFSVFMLAKIASSVVALRVEGGKGGGNAQWPLFVVYKCTYNRMMQSSEGSGRKVPFYVRVVWNDEDKQEGNLKACMCTSKLRKLSRWRKKTFLALKINSGKKNYDSFAFEWKKSPHFKAGKKLCAN